MVGRAPPPGVAVVPQGGNTGLVGGGVPLDGEVVLSTAAARRRRARSTALAGQVTVGAGATLAALQAARRPAPGWAYGVDLAARDTATVGGMVATNAGGLRVRPPRPTRAPGARRRGGAGATARSCRHLGGLEKDNTGYDLAGLLCGSEGTLGVVTAVRLRLVARPRAGRRRCSASPTSPRPWRRWPAAAPAAPSRGGRAVPRRRPGSWPRTSGVPPPFGGPPRPAGRVAAAGDPTERCWPRPPAVDVGAWPSPPTAPGGPSCGATARPTPRRSTRSGRRTSST